MAENTVAAAGPTRGASYVLPWDAMAQYDQMVTRSKEQYEAQNQQRLATIADMEKQDLTGMPSYDTALENHYEQLHKEMGKVITKYRDPFESLEGMREMKSIQAKYIANPIVNNAKTTETSFKALQSDLANNIITKEDYDIKKAEYDKHITDGDITKPFEYAQPDYVEPTTVVAKIASSFEKTFKETAYSTTSGYTDEQIGNIYDAAFIDKSRDRFMLGVENYAKSKNYGVITDEKRRKEIGEEYIRMMLPWKVDKKEKTEGDGIDSGIYTLRTSMDANTGNLNTQDARNYVRKNTDGSLAINNIGIAAGNGEYSFQTKGKWTFDNSDHYDSDTKQLNSQILGTKVQLVNDIGDKITTAARKIGLKGNIWSGSTDDSKETETNAVIDEKSFNALGMELGFSDEAIKAIKDNYLQGYNKSLFQGMIYGNLKFDPKDNQSGLSANAFLYHIADKTVTAVEANEVFSNDIEADLYNLHGTKSKSSYVRLHGVQLDSNVSMAAASKTNKDNNTGTPEQRRMWQQMQVKTLTADYDIIRGGIVFAKTQENRYDGFTNMNTGERAGNTDGRTGISQGLAHVMESKDLSWGAVERFDEQRRIAEKGQREAENNPNIEYRYSVLNGFFRGLTPEQIRNQMTTKGKNGLSIIDMATQIDEPTKTDKGIILSPKERMIIELTKEYLK